MHACILYVYCTHMIYKLMEQYSILMPRKLNCLFIQTEFTNMVKCNSVHPYSLSCELMVVSFSPIKHVLFTYRYQIREGLRGNCSRLTY